jgi:tRNA (cytidine56-2'-O)-methyltransferase
MISVLRIGHRIKRDARISTHCGLVARAFGAGEVVFSGEEDRSLIKGIKKVVKNWGGPFKAYYARNYRKVIAKYKKRHFVVVHLTMYGMGLDKEIRKIRKKKNILVIIGSEKVPGEIYHAADYNIAVTNQPHSEVAALAVFLQGYLSGRQKKFRKARLKIIPQKSGKKVVG